EIKRLKRSRIPLVKVRWNSRRGPEFTWEREDSFKKKYPHLFTKRASSSTTRELPAKVNKARVVISSVTSAVTYTSVYTNSEPGIAFWGADDEEISEGGIPRVIVLGYDGLPIQLVAPPSPDYIPGPEDPQTPPVPQDEDEREPMFTGNMILTSAELYTLIGFRGGSRGVRRMMRPEDGPVDYPMDGGDDGDDNDGDSSGDDTDEDEDDEDKEEEHLAPTYSTIVAPVDEPVFPPEGTEPVIPPPSTRTQLRGTIRLRSTGRST
ncbi:hypothetical protein Tco_0504809, partial [Tanacetum coccineum]